VSLFDYLFDSEKFWITMKLMALSFQSGAAALMPIFIVQVLDRVSIIRHAHGAEHKDKNAKHISPKRSKGALECLVVFTWSSTNNKSLCIIYEITQIDNSGKLPTIDSTHQ
jgi:hypothetical protein